MDDFGVPFQTWLSRRISAKAALEHPWSGSPNLGDQLRDGLHAQLQGSFAGGMPGKSSNSMNLNSFSESILWIPLVYLRQRNSLFSWDLMGKLTISMAIFNSYVKLSDSKLCVFLVLAVAKHD